MPGKKKSKNVTTSLGICQCGQIIKKGQKIKIRNGRKYHAKCAP